MQFSKYTYKAVIDFLYLVRNVLSVMLQYGTFLFLICSYFFYIITLTLDPDCFQDIPQLTPPFLFFKFVGYILMTSSLGNLFVALFSTRFGIHAFLMLEDLRKGTWSTPKNSL